MKMKVKRRVKMSQNENERENEKFDIKIKKSIKIYNEIKKRKIVTKYFFTKSQNWIKTECSWKKTAKRLDVCTQINILQFITG